MENGNGIVSKSEFAQKVGVTKGRVSQLIHLGLPVRADGGIDLEAASAWYRRNITPTPTSKPAAAQPQQAADPNDYREARRQREWVRLEREQLQLRRLTGEVIDVAEEENAWATIARTMRENLMALPETLAAELASLTDPRLVKEKLDTEFRSLLMNLPDQIRSAASN